MAEQVRVGVFGGTGLYQMEGLSNVRDVELTTPFGDPSDAITIGELDGTAIAFLPRHGRGHRLLPTEIPVRANVYAMKELGVEESALPQVIRRGYALLHLLTFFTTASKLLQAWTVQQDTRAPQAAGTIHTDFEQKFIRAEVIGVEDLVRCGSEAAARAQGLMRLEGKAYVVRDGDVIIILEAMKMETEVRAPRDGLVGTVSVAEGDKVVVGDTLLTLG